MSNCNISESRFPVFLHNACSFSAVCSAAGAEGGHGKHRLIYSTVQYRHDPEGTGVFKEKSERT